MICCQWIKSKISSSSDEHCGSRRLSHIYHSKLDVWYSYLLLSTFNKSVDMLRLKRLWLRLCGTHSRRAMLSIQFDVGQSVNVGGSWKPFCRLVSIGGRCRKFCMCIEAELITHNGIEVISDSHNWKAISRTHHITRFGAITIGSYISVEGLVSKNRQ